LANTDFPEIHLASLKATIDFASEINATLVVYHGSTCKAGDAETERLYKIASHAAKRGVKVAVENIFRQHADEKSYRINPQDLAAQIATVDSPALGICFDFGHAFISAREEGFDFLESFKATLPRLAHVHIHDNFGKTAAPGTKPLDALFQGLGDLHLPPGQAAIPYDTLFPLFSPNYQGVYMMEIQPRFATEYEKALGWMQKMTRGEIGAPWPGALGAPSSA
jgi:sugar phosphate isomerase/epimerase